jgi:hypothetical protein
MGALGGPKIVKPNSLKFFYDITVPESYSGEPISNLIPSSDRNGRFTTSNSWGTYNTNQYNGNTDFSLVTISDITNNVVTLDPVGRSIRTYDVLNPATTGGGVTAGTDYFIKKLTSSTFTLHAYNSSQNGSQGYINSTTGKFKVHDSMWLNGGTPVSINETGFPTMWHGAPHKPNSHLVKEIVNGAGPNGQSVMRLHTHGNSVRDGMAYSVYAPVTAGVQYTASFLYRTSLSGLSLTWSTYSGGNSTPSKGVTPTDTNWHRFSKTWTQSVNYSLYSYWWPTAHNVAYYFDMADYQITTGSSPKKFFAGTRSSTSGLKDLSPGENHANLSSLTYSNDYPKFENRIGLRRNKFTFDGTDDYIALSGTINLGNTFTIIAWVKPNSQDSIIYGTAANGADNWFGVDSTNKPHVFLTESADLNNVMLTSDITVSTTKFNHVAMTINGSTAKIYVNGSLRNSTTRSFTIGSWNSTVNSIGRRANLGQRYFKGSIESIRGYTVVLSDGEINKDYRTTKSKHLNGV